MPDGRYCPDGYRLVRVKATWSGYSDVEVPNEHPKIAHDDLDSILKFEDITATTASLEDWSVEDDGPEDE